MFILSHEKKNYTHYSELDNKKQMSFSRCKMYNLSTSELLELELGEKRNMSEDYHISKFE